MISSCSLLGYRMTCPQRCPEEVYKVMQRCWQYNPEERPKFSDLQRDLSAIKKKWWSSRRPKQKSLLNYMDGADGGLNTCVSIQLKKKKNTRQKHTLTDPQQNKEQKCREMSCSGQHWTSPPGTNQHLSINWLTLHKPESSEIRWWNLRLNLFLKRKTPNVFFFFNNYTIS